MKRKTIYLLQCIVVILLLACSEDDLQSLQAAFESDLQEVTIGESITFKDISTGEPSKWNWRFEGGEPETSILFSPNVVYNKPGVYSVTLSVGRGEEANEMVKEQYITVNYPSQITVDFSADKTTATNEDVISFKDFCHALFCPFRNNRKIFSSAFLGFFFVALQFVKYFLTFNNNFIWYVS